jgi:N-formylglutamate amidohydrolase
MEEQPPEPIAFARLGQSGASSPLVIAVPHAGRCYPPQLLAAARLPLSALETIEDRHADLLVSDAVRAGAVAIVACMARAWVDLNRDEREIDPAILAEPQEPGATIVSPKVTGGLGVIPSRIAAGGAVWRHPLTDRELAARIEGTHRPYHQAIAAALAAAQARHGIAILLDCHSMPPLGRAPGVARVVVGDRHGRSAGARFTAAAIEAVTRAGFPIARNSPYAGGHSLTRHGEPRLGRHALQIEIDRSLYLDVTQREPGPGLARARGIVTTVARALIEAAGALPIAAE